MKKHCFLDAFSGTYQLCSAYPWDRRENTHGLLHVKSVPFVLGMGDLTFEANGGDATVPEMPRSTFPLASDGEGVLGVASAHLRRQQARGQAHPREATGRRSAGPAPSWRGSAPRSSRSACVRLPRRRLGVGRGGQLRGSRGVDHHRVGDADRRPARRGHARRDRGRELRELRRRDRGVHRREGVYVARDDAARLADVHHAAGRGPRRDGVRGGGRLRPHVAARAVRGAPSRPLRR